MNNIKILRAGLYTTVQDMRRIGYKRYGIPDSGPMDEYSHVLANWLVGKNYLSETSRGFNTDNWTTQLIQIFKDFPETQFYWVVNEDASPLVCNNVKSITYKDLDKRCQA